MHIDTSSLFANIKIPQQVPYLLKKVRIDDVDLQDFFSEIKQSDNIYKSDEYQLYYQDEKNLAKILIKNEQDFQNYKIHKIDQILVLNPIEKVRSNIDNCAGLQLKEGSNTSQTSVMKKIKQKQTQLNHKIQLLQQKLRLQAKKQIETQMIRMLQNFEKQQKNSTQKSFQTNRETKKMQQKHTKQEYKETKQLKNNIESLVDSLRAITQLSEKDALQFIKKHPGKELNELIEAFYN